MVTLNLVMVPNRPGRSVKIDCCDQMTTEKSLRCFFFLGCVSRRDWKGDRVSVNNKQRAIGPVSLRVASFYLKSGSMDGQ